MTQEQQSIIDLADAIGGEVYESYSGRGMFGRTCMGISFGDASTVLYEAKSAGLPKPKLDSLGIDWITYWPSVPAMDAEAKRAAFDAAIDAAPKTSVEEFDRAAYAALDALLEGGAA